MIQPEELVGEDGRHGIDSHRPSAGLNPSNSGKFTSVLVARLKPNPILKVLSSIRSNRVRALLMGGQACVFYGAAEFSRDTDLALLASSENFARLNKTLADLDAHFIAVPPFETQL